MIPPPARWAIAAPPDPDATQALAAELHLPLPLATLLVQRGYGAPDTAKAFLRPELAGLSDGLAWADMRVALDLVTRAVRAGHPILVHGDYDVDGQCGAAMLTRVLRAAGATVQAFVPHRLRDGYDFGPAGLAAAKRLGARLIITCDCGITAVAAVRAGRAAGRGGKPLRAGHVGFILAPRLNAAGRIGDANDGLRLLLTDDPDEAARVARELETLNARRQALDQRILDEAIDLAGRTLRAEDYALVLAAEGWHPGVIGIVASRLVERFGRPTFLIGWEPGGELGRGSGRSIVGFDLHDALHRVGHTLEKYGGHMMAAGLTIRRARYEEFRVAFLGVAGELLGPDDLVPHQRVDLELPLGMVSEELERLMRHLEPCGPGNPAPVFGVRGARALGSRRVGLKHPRSPLDDGAGIVAAIGV